ncbi:hypothetical protein PU629_02610 [Pullulanibacillus sp. KACC 23026]|uniref:CBO0543 family protein n=1 Tax=Pullulanibacillus sp. KACC 23026 TaxID=3028315 RepID=UPI0023AF9687|nr:CBO0543 family protein [Pullulanibacillus sp. KACC 23026]WEG13275.1 hypothetical protein PU629_02610 [Pullulanibacillus sp. KACC 23026]
MIVLVLVIMGINVFWFFMPKRLTGAEMLYASFFAIAFQQFIDVYLDLKLDLYGYFNKGVDWGYIFVILGFFPGLNCIFLNFYPFNNTLLKKAIYIGMWALFSTLYEELSIHLSYFYYHNWTIWFSIPMYPVLLIINIQSLKWFRHLNKDSL